jgi:hypothetical protein
MKHSLPKILLYTLLLVLINSIQGCSIDKDLEEPTSIASEEESILTKNPTPNSKGQTVIPSHQATQENSSNTNSSTILTGDSTHNGGGNKENHCNTNQESLKTSSDSSTIATGDSTHNGGGNKENHCNTNQESLKTSSGSSTIATGDSTRNGGGNNVVFQVGHAATQSSQQSNRSADATTPGVLKNPTPNSDEQTVIPSHQPTQENSLNTKQQHPKTSSGSSTIATGDSTNNGGGNNVVPQVGHAATQSSQQSEEHDNNTINHLGPNGEQKKHGHAQPLNKVQQQELQSLVKNLDAAMKQSINTFLTQETNEKAIDSLDDAMKLLENGKMTMGLLLLFERAIDTAEQQHSEIDHGCVGIHNNFFTKKDKLTKNLAEIKKLLTQCPK